MEQVLEEQIINECGKQNAFIFEDKKLGALLFYVVPNPSNKKTGTLYCQIWGREWKFVKMERNGEQWLYRFSYPAKDDVIEREYNLPKDFLDTVQEKTGLKITS